MSDGNTTRSVTATSDKKRSTKTSARSRRRVPDSTSSSSSLSSSSDLSSLNKKKRSRRKKFNRNRRREDSRRDELLEKLANEVSELRNQAYRRDTSQHDCGPECSNNDVLDLNDSSEIGNDEDAEDTTNVPPSDFSINFGTSLKTPPIPKTPQEFLDKLSELQRFDSPDWSEIRYAEVQKNYGTTPGYVELETNDEIKAFDNARHLAYMEKSYAALSLAALKQQAAFQERVREFLSWMRNPENSSQEKVGEKINEIMGVQIQSKSNSIG